MATITALDVAKIAVAVYRFDPIVGEYKLAKDINGDDITFSDPTTDLQMALYQNTTTGNYVVAFRGTASASDWGTDIQMGISTIIGVLANQFTPAGETLANWIRDFSLSSSNTAIVGHSLGGALAQYFGANTGFETLTYNAYGAGNIDGAASGGSNITNYVTLSDFVSKLPMSSMIGTTYMLQDGDLLDILGHGITNFTSEESWVRGYTPIDDIHSIYAIDGLALSAADVAAELIDIGTLGSGDESKPMPTLLINLSLLLNIIS